MPPKNNCYGYFKKGDPSCKVCKAQDTCKDEASYIKAYFVNPVLYMRQLEKIYHREPYRTDSDIYY